MSIILVRAALETLLATITPALATENENVPFEATEGVAYQRIDLMTVEPENPVLGCGFYRERGIFQITLMYPLNNGTGDAGARAELIRSTFKRGATMTSGGIIVKVESTPEISRGRVDGERWAVPVKIKWYSDKFI